MSTTVEFVEFVCAKTAKTTAGLHINVNIVVSIINSGSGIIDANFPLPKRSAMSISIFIMTPMINITRISGKYSVTARTDSETHDICAHAVNVTNLSIYTVISF